MTIGGRWTHTGFKGYREVPAIAGPPCWALLVREPREMHGSPLMWEIDYRDLETGYLQCGSYPHYGRYRLLQKFLHREVVYRSKWQYQMRGKELVKVPASDTVFELYRMEPNGLMLDLMLPMLVRWRKLSNAQKIEHLRQEEQAEKDEFSRKAKDARQSCRVRPGSPLVQKRAEIIEEGMRKAMAIAAQTGLGMKISA